MQLRSNLFVERLCFHEHLVQILNESSAYSIYMDPNVPMDEYDFCDETWIEDGMCVHFFNLTLSLSLCKSL